MTLSQYSASDDDIIAALHIEAVREGQSLWFRVASGSMHPILRIGEQVRIEPTTAEQVQVGEIAAFETGEGLVIHRIVQQRQEVSGIQLLEMSDAHFRAERVASSAVVGRVVAIHQGHAIIDLQRPLAQKCGQVTARLRYRLYTMRSSSKLTRLIIRKSARLVARLGSWYIRHFCASSQLDITTYP